MRQVIRFTPFRAERAELAARFPNDVFATLRALDYVLMHKANHGWGE